MIKSAGLDVQPRAGPLGAYDPRVIVATSVEIRGTNLHVNAAGLHLE